MKNANQNSPTKSMKKPVKATPVKTASVSAKDLRQLLVDGLKDIYWAEKALTAALPKMIKNATSSDLMSALKSHLEETKNQVTKVEEVFATLGEKVVAKKCAAMEGLIKEAEDIIKDTDEGAVMDAGIISGAQKIEHYEIASYGTLASFAKTLGEEDAASLLEEILAEEKETDETLSQLAETSINAAAGGMTQNVEDKGIVDIEEDEEDDEEDDKEDEDMDLFENMDEVEYEEEDDYEGMPMKTRRQF